MEELKQVVESRSYRSHKQGVDFHVPNEEFVGKRGGRKIPLEIVWKQCGYGLGAMVFRVCSCTVLYPRVGSYSEKSNGSGWCPSVESL